MPPTHSFLNQGWCLLLVLVGGHSVLYEPSILTNESYYVQARISELSLTLGTAVYGRCPGLASTPVKPQSRFGANYLKIEWFVPKTGLRF